MMIVEIDSPTFPLITFIIRGKSRKMKVSRSPLKELRKRLGSPSALCVGLGFRGHLVGIH